MKVIVLDPIGVVTCMERDIHDWFSLDFEYVCEDISGYIDNDCVVIIYHEEVFDLYG